MSSITNRTRLAVAAGVFTAGLSKQLGRGEGSVIGGRVSLALDPQSLERLSNGRTIALVSGTNGKTTTTAMLTAAMKTRGAVVTNAAGANMFGGMVSALSHPNVDVAVLEVDEGHLPKALEATRPRLVVLLNLTRDQLDRVGEVRMQAQKWRTALAQARTVVVANADDPMVVWAASTASARVWVSAGNNWRLDAASCPSCGERILWTDDDWSCRQCELRRPIPHALVRRRRPDAPAVGGEPSLSVDELRLPLDLAMPGEVNQANAAFAVTAAMLLGAAPSAAVDAIGTLPGAGGRFTSVNIAGAPARLLLAKNPAGWTEALRIARSDGSPLVVAINARVQDGRDPSWLWDVPYEQLQGRFVVVTGERGRDLAVRLRYADVEHIHTDDFGDAVREASRRNGGQEIDVLANYSAFQEFRKKADPQ